MPLKIATRLKKNIESDYEEKIIEEIFINFSMWTYLEEERIEKDYPKIKKAKGKKRAEMMMNKFCDEMAELGTDIAKYRKKDALQQYLNYVEKQQLDWLD